MTNTEALELFKSTGALLDGHFVLRSGLHSRQYFQCALALQQMPVVERFGAALAEKVKSMSPETIISPAMCGLVIGQEVARALPDTKGTATAGVPAIFAERDASGVMCLRRGFTLRPDQHVLVVEDVWTTGGSTLETIQVVEEAGGRVVAAGALIDRSAGKIEFPVEAQALLDLPIASYEPEDCPQCREGGAAVKPGSRFVRSV